MVDIEKAYRDLIRPQNLIKYISDFEEWLDLAEDIESLKATLTAFEKEEMYEECVIIRDKIEERLERIEKHLGL